MKINLEKAKALSEETKEIKVENEHQETDLFGNPIIQNEKAKKEAKKEPKVNTEVIKKALETAVGSVIKGLNEKSVETMKGLLTGTIEDVSKKITEEVKKQVELTRHIVKVQKKKEVVIEHPLHQKFDTVSKLLLHKKNVYLYGEAGTGKTQIAEDLAKSFDLPLYNLTSGDMVGIYGFKDISGNFNETPFTKAFKNGGVLYISEFDSIDPSISLTLNTALANKITTINGETIRANENFYCICDGNTCGNGASLNYSGRIRQDSATLNRFAFVNVDYDENIELYLANQNKTLCTFLRKVRKVAKESRINLLVSYRQIKDISELEEDIDLNELLMISLFKGMSIDELNVISKGVNQSNKYATALENIIKNYQN